MVTGTLTADGWAVTFGTVKKGFSLSVAHDRPLLTVLNVKFYLSRPASFSLSEINKRARQLDYC